MTEYVLIENVKYRIILLVEEKEFDYYTDVCIELIRKESKIVLFKDNLLALKNIIKSCNEEIFSLNIALDEQKLGLLLNEYYKFLYEEGEHEKLVLDNKGQWIGEKYCLFTSMKCVTWIYQYKGDIIIKVTPVFRCFEEDEYIEEYSTFIKNYGDILREKISLQELRNVNEIILKVYDKLQDKLI